MAIPPRLLNPFCAQQKALVKLIDGLLNAGESFSAYEIGRKLTTITTNLKNQLKFLDQFDSEDKSERSFGEWLASSTKTEYQIQDWLKNTDHPIYLMFSNLDKLISLDRQGELNTEEIFNKIRDIFNRVFDSLPVNLRSYVKEQVSNHFTEGQKTFPTAGEEEEETSINYFKNLDPEDCPLTLWQIIGWDHLD